MLIPSLTQGGFSVSKKGKKIDTSRRGFLTGSFLSRSSSKKEETAKPMAETSSAVEFLRAGNEAYAKGEYEDAVTQYKAFLKMEPRNTPGRVRLGHTLYKLGRNVQAKVEFERVLKLDEKENEARLYLGLTLMRMGKPDKAAEHWKKYFNPQEVPIQREINLQVAYVEAGDEVDPFQIADAVEQVVTCTRSGSA